jgi:hypothetical protein
MEYVAVYLRVGASRGRARAEDAAGAGGRRRRESSQRGRGFSSRCVTVWFSPLVSLSHAAAAARSGGPYRIQSLPGFRLCRAGPVSTGS